jgi:hypothetical protein
LLKHFKLSEGAVTTVREYFELVNRDTPGIEKICTHPKEAPERRLAGLIRGLEKVGMRNRDAKQMP